MHATNTPPLDEATLIHYGIKGMRWGFRNEDEPGGFRAATKKEDSKSGSNPYALTDDKRILAGGKAKPSDSETMKGKYGPGSLGDRTKEPEGRLTKEQKETLQSVAVIAGVGAAIWLLYRAGAKAEDKMLLNAMGANTPEAKGRNLNNFLKEWKLYQGKAFGSSQGYSKDFVNKLSNEGVNEKAGAIFRRVSTEKESSIRPGGFYASHKPEDVDRYKAILPVFWKQWGKDTSKGGYVVNLKAKTDIKAPSPRDTFERFKKMLDDDVEHSSVYFPGEKRTSKFRDLFGLTSRGMDDDSAARKIFPQAAGMWINESHPGTKHFFRRLKEDGFNAVVDMNDAGSLAGRPMRIIDGSIFEVAGHDRLTPSAIATAQENIKAIAHAIMALMGMHTVAGEAYLQHAGVKGMKWGVRKAKPPPSPEQIRRRNELIVKTAIGVGAVATAAILLKRGGFKLSSPAAKKITLGGAKMAFRIISKTGRVMATTSIKIGKVGVKGSAKAGTLVAKGAAKGAVAGTQAAGRAIAQNGTKVYENVIKKSALATVRAGSNLSYKLIGKGTPAVKEVAKRSWNLSPTDLLLNTRND